MFHFLSNSLVILQAVAHITSVFFTKLETQVYCAYIIAQLCTRIVQSNRQHLKFSGVHASLVYVYMYVCTMYMLCDVRFWQCFSLSNNSLDAKRFK